MASHILKMKLISLIAMTFVVNACAPIAGKSDSNSTTLSSTVSAPTQGDSSGAAYQPYPLLWESAEKNGLLWSSYAYQLVGGLPSNQMLNGSEDVSDFCPNYAALSSSQRVNFWAFLISAVAKYESGFNPLSRYEETTQGIDAITHLPVYSEGLLQLSYQDIQPYPFCEFNWAIDRLLSPTDPNKSILDPFTNLSCGIQILGAQIERTGKIALSSGVYWSTLQLGGTYSKIPEIEAMTQAIPFCQK